MHIYYVIDLKKHTKTNKQQQQKQNKTKQQQQTKINENSNNYVSDNTWITAITSVIIKDNISSLK